MSQPARILIGLIIGLTIGLLTSGWSGEAQAIAIAEPIGQLWLTALQMTIIPLVVALLVTGIATTADAVRGGRLAGWAIVFFLAFLWSATIVVAFLFPVVVGLIPMPTEAASALRNAFATAAPVDQVPTIADFLGSILPSNPVTAAAENSILQLILFTLIFAFAITRLPLGPRETLVGFFRALGEAMLVMVNWVLWLAPIGVFALAFTVGARAGAAAFGALLHYVLIVSIFGLIVLLLAYPIGVLGGRVPLRTFARGAAPAQAVAISTQSSLASLPAMLRGAGTMGIPVAGSGVVLPLAVAMFRATSPGMNLAVALFIAHLLGVELSPLEIAAGVAVAATTTLGSVSLPSQVSFITSIAPICVVMGVPVAPLALLIAVEFIPDIVRTVGNVTMDLAATATISNRSKAGEAVQEEEGLSEEDRLLKAGEA